MGTSVGIVIGFLGIAILIAPFIIQIYVGTKQTNKNNKKALEAASAIMAIAIIFYAGGIILAAYYSGKEIAAAGAMYSGEGGKFIEQHPQLALLAA